MTGGTHNAIAAAAAAQALLSYLAEHGGRPSWLVTRIVEDGQRVLVAEDPRFEITCGQVLPLDPGEEPALRNADLLITPIVGSTGIAFGSLIGLDERQGERERNGQEGQPADLPALLELLAGTLGAIYTVELARVAYARSSSRAAGTGDSLTGFGTVRQWHTRAGEEADRWQHLGESLAVITVELGQLKQHNERYGHDSGNAQLVAVAEMVRAAIDDRDFAARTSGNTLSMMIIDRSRAEVADTGGKLRQALSEAGTSATVGVSFHTAGTQPDAALAEDELSSDRAAAPGTIDHLAALRAPSGPNGPDAELRNEILRGAIRPYFQPIVDMCSGQVVVVEALARWQTDVDVREPAAFLPRLEQAGLLGLMFDQFLDQGLQTLAEFRHILPKLGLGLNLTLDAMAPEILLACLDGRLREHHLEPRVLSLEISDQQTVNLPASTQQLLVDIADMGVRLVLDDFGPNSAPLETLAAVPLTGVKLSRRLTSLAINVPEPAQIQAPIAAAAAAGLVMIAGGIETQVQCDRLIRLGCTFGQGYLFAVPQAPDSLASLISGSLISMF